MWGDCMDYSKILIVGAGGFLGSALRYAVTCATAKSLGGFPVGTLLVNVIGGFIMGVIMEASASGFWPVTPGLKVFLTTGILGGLTTFSTFSYETVSYFSAGKLFMGTANAAMNLILSLAAAWAGKCLIYISCSGR